MNQKMKSTQEELSVPCPICHKPVAWNENSIYRPFCSKRCQLIDLGEWANEEKSIPCDTADFAEDGEFGSNEWTGH